MPLNEFNVATQMLIRQLAAIPGNAAAATQALHGYADAKNAASSAAASTSTSPLDSILDRTAGGNFELRQMLQAIAQTMLKLKNAGNLEPGDVVQTQKSLQLIENIARKIAPFFMSFDTFEQIITRATTKSLVNAATGKVPGLGTSGGGKGGFTFSFGSAPAAPSPNRQSLASQISTGQVRG